MSDRPATHDVVDELTDVERAVLDFEARTWRYAGAKEQAVRQTFGLSLTSYTQRVVALLDRPAAVAYSPMLVHRLQRRVSGRR